MRGLWPVTTDSGEKVEPGDIATLRVDDGVLGVSTCRNDALNNATLHFNPCTTLTRPIRVMYARFWLDLSLPPEDSLTPAR